MNAMLDPNIVAVRIHLSKDLEQGETWGVASTTASSHGGLKTFAIISSTNQITFLIPSIVLRSIVYIRYFRFHHAKE
jgi:hypothetical protein